MYWKGSSVLNSFYLKLHRLDLSIQVCASKIEPALCKDVEAVLVIWFQDVRLRNIPVGEPQEKAWQLAELLHREKFWDMWQNRFWKRFRIAALMK